MNFYHSGGILLTRKTSVHQQRAQDGHGGKFFININPVRILKKPVTVPIFKEILEPVGLDFKTLWEVVGCYFHQMALDIAAAFPDNSTNMITDPRHK